MRLPTASLTACSAVLLVAALTGCGGDGKAPAQPRIEPVAAQQLASLGDEVADLAARDECAAAQRADDLLAAAEEARETGRLPAALAPEVVARSQELVDELNCPPPPPPPPTTDEDEDDHGDGKGRGKQKKRGDEE
jgi:hypothetical protein